MKVEDASPPPTMELKVSKVFSGDASHTGTSILKRSGVGGGVEMSPVRDNSRERKERAVEGKAGRALDGSLGAAAGGLSSGGGATGAAGAAGVGTGAGAARGRGVSFADGPAAGDMGKVAIGGSSQRRGTKGGKSRTPKDQEGGGSPDVSTGASGEHNNSTGGGGARGPARPVRAPSPLGPNRPVSTAGAAEGKGSTPAPGGDPHGGADAYGGDSKYDEDGLRSGSDSGSGSGSGSGLRGFQVPPPSGSGGGGGEGASENAEGWSTASTAPSVGAAVRIAIGVNKWKKKARETAFNYRASSKAADSLKERASMMLESSKNQVEGIPLREGLQVRIAATITLLII